MSAALSAAWNSFCRRFLIHPPARKTEALLADYSLTIWSIQGTNHATHSPLDVIITLTDVCSCAQRWPVWWPHRGRRTASESCSGAMACGARSTRCWPSTSRWRPTAPCHCRCPSHLPPPPSPRKASRDPTRTPSPLVRVHSFLPSFVLFFAADTTTAVENGVYQVVTAFYDHLPALKFPPAYARKLQSFADFQQ